MKNTDKNLVITDVVKGTLISIITLSICVLVFAGLVTVTRLSNSVIKPVNQFIKVISIFCGCFFSFGNKKGYLKGLLTGVLFAVISYVLFAILGGETVFGFSFLIDVFFCSAIGTILGILTVSIKK